MRARAYSTEAIALRRMDFGEADRIVTVLTPYQGKLRLLARGVRRPTSRMAGHLEPFTHARIQVARGRSLDIVTQAATVTAFRDVRENMAKAAYAFHFGELVDSFLQEADPHPRVFGLLLDALEGLSGSAIAPQLVARYFELQLLSVVGFRPELATCLVCRAEIQPAANGYSARLGGVVCSACVEGEPSAIPISPDGLKLLRFLQRAPKEKVALSVAGRVLAEAERVLRDHLELVLERRLRAREFVREVTGGTP